MITMMITLLLVFVVIIFMYIRKGYPDSKSVLPKGPRGYPLIGNNLQIIRNAPLQLSKWADEYGKLYTIRIANGKTALVINDGILMTELFGKLASTGKFGSELFILLFGGQYGVANTEGRRWQEQRNFCAKTLSKFGLGKGSSLVPVILSEIDNLCNWFVNEMHEKGKVHLSGKLKESSGNTLWSMITGERMKSDLPNLIKRFEETLQKAANSGLPFFPWLKYVSPEWSGFNAYTKVVDEIQELVQVTFEQCESDEKKDNVVSAFIKHVNGMKDQESSFFSENGFRHSRQSIVALLLAGVEPTALALHWLIIYLCTHPDVQAKLQAEISEVVGSNRDPNLDDRNMMPYTGAVIQETLRKSSVGPLGLMQKLSEDTNFHGYKLPKGLLLIPNIYHVHNDRSVWGDPEKFRPERWVEVTEESRKKLNKYMVAFQPGKRTCLGEQIARDSLFLFTVKLFMKFKFLPHDHLTSENYLEPQIGLLMVPKNYCVRILPRN